jgi:hypothetical protein
METLTGTLSQRVDELVRAHQAKPLLSTLGTAASIEELTRRYVGLERAVREIALEVEKLASPRQS